MSYRQTEAIPKRSDASRESPFFGEYALAERTAGDCRRKDRSDLMVELKTPAADGKKRAIAAKEATECISFLGVACRHRQDLCGGCTGDKKNKLQKLPGVAYEEAT